MNKLAFIAALVLSFGMISDANASFAKELLACEWSSDEYLLLRASLPRAGTGYYYIEKIDASGKTEVARFEDTQMQLLHSAGGGSPSQLLSSVYSLRDSRHQFLVHFLKAVEQKDVSGFWFVNLPGYRTEGVVATSCVECEMDNNYCRDLFAGETNTSGDR